MCGTNGHSDPLNVEFRSVGVPLYMGSLFFFFHTSLLFPLAGQLRTPTPATPNPTPAPSPTHTAPREAGSRAERGRAGHGGGRPQAHMCARVSAREAARARRGPVDVERVHTRVRGETTGAVGQWKRAPPRRKRSERRPWGSAVGARAVFKETWRRP